MRIVNRSQCVLFLKYKKSMSIFHNGPMFLLIGNCKAIVNDFEFRYFNADFRLQNNFVLYNLCICGPKPLI